jgi:hypothetical protein
MEFKIDFKNCHINSLHNVKLNKKYKIRAGSVLYKSQILEGNENINVSVRNYYPPNGHSWIETDDGYIIDWVLNHKIGNGIKMFNIEALENMGIKYIHHENEKGIINKIKKYYK